MILPSQPIFTPAELAAAQRWASRPSHHDTSSDGRFEACPQSDCVEITDRQSGTVRQLKTGRLQPLEVTVTDDGRTAAFTAVRDDNKSVLSIVRDGLPPNELPLNGDVIRSPDFSPDGSKLVGAKTTCVVTVDSKGEHSLAHLPNWVDAVEYLPGGRVIARCDWYSWGTQKIPVYWVINGAGQAQAVKNPQLADWLGKPVLKPLLESLEAAYPGSTPAQRQTLLERFGYDGPTLRLRAPDESHMIFRVDGAFETPGPASGTWLLRTDGSNADAVKLIEAEHGDLEGKKLSSVHWSDKSSRSAVLFGDSADKPGRLAVAESDGRFTMLPLALDRGGKTPCAWSPDERWLVWQVPEGERTNIFCFDSKSGNWFPLAADAHLEGWHGERVRVRRKNDTLDDLLPLPLDLDKAVGIVLGDAGHRHSGEVKVTDDHVVVNGIKIPRRHQGEHT